MYKFFALFAPQPHQSDWMIHLVALVLDWLHQYYEILRSWYEEGCVGGGAAAFNNCEPPKLLDPEREFGEPQTRC